MEQLKASKDALDGRLQRITARLENTHTAMVTLDDLNAEMDYVQELWNDFRELRKMMLDLSLDGDALEEQLDFEESATTRLNTLKATINHGIRELMKSEADHHDGSSVSGDGNLPHPGEPLMQRRHSTHHGVRLATPELQLPRGILPTFSGEYEEWSSFYDYLSVQFTKMQV